MGNFSRAMVASWLVMDGDALAASVAVTAVGKEVLTGQLKEALG